LRIENTRHRTSIGRLFVVLAAAFAIVGLASCGAQAISVPYTVSSNYILFDIDNKILYCEGQTEFLHKMIRFQAKTMRVDVKSHVLIAEGDVVVTSMAPLTGAGALPGAPAVATSSLQFQTITEEADARLQEEAQSRENSRVQTYEGDQLRFDIERLTGDLVQTRKNMRHIYIQGAALQEVSELPVIGEGTYLYDEPSITTNAVTAVRFRVSPGDQYEAWQSKIWVKGNKVLSLPYYTNTARKFTPGKWRINNVRYSSNTSWGIGGNVKYNETKGKEGFVNVGYRKEGEQRYTLGLKQSFALNARTGGGLTISNLFGSDHSYGLSFMRHGGTMRNISADMSYSEDNPFNVNISGNTRFNKMRLRGYLHSSSSGKYDASSLSGLVDLDRDTRYIGNKRKIGYNFNAHGDWRNDRYNSSEGSMFVAVSAFRSAINITKRSHLNISTNTGIGADTEGGARTSVGAALRYGVNVGRGKLFNISYNVRNGRSSGTANADQSLSTSFSLSKGMRWNTNISTSYNLRASQIGEVSTSVDYRFSKKCRLWSSLVYNTELSRFTVKNYNMSYNLYGTTINTSWFTEGNDFIIDFVSNFR